MKKIFTLGVLFLLSGTISALFTDKVGELGIWFFPGAVFGVAGGIYAFLDTKRSLLRSILIVVWVLASTASYYAAVYSAIFMVTKEVSETLYVPFFVAGIIGGALMLLSWRVCIEAVRLPFLFLLVVLSGVLGMTPMIFSDPINKDLPLRALFLVWQLGMGVALGFAAKFSEAPVSAPALPQA